MTVEFVFDVGKKSKTAFKIELQEHGYSNVVANRIWDWYTNPTGDKDKRVLKKRETLPNDDGEQTPVSSQR